MILLDITHGYLLIYLNKVLIYRENVTALTVIQIKISVSGIAYAVLLKVPLKETVIN